MYVESLQYTTSVGKFNKWPCFSGYYASKYANHNISIKNIYFKEEVYSELDEKWSNYIKIYTDGSKNNNGNTKFSFFDSSSDETFFLLY